MSEVLSIIMLCIFALLTGLSIHHLKQGETDIPNSRAIHTLKMKLQEIMRGSHISSHYVKQLHMYVCM